MSLDADTTSSAPQQFVEELDLDALFEDYGGASGFFESAWAVAPIVLQAPVLKDDATALGRLQLNLTTIETLLSVQAEQSLVSDPQHEACTDINCSAAFRSSMSSSIASVAPKLRPEAADIFAASDSPDLHSAICLGYNIHCRGVEHLWAPVSQFLRKLITTTELLWKASLHVFPNDQGWASGIRLVDGLRHALILQIAGVSCWTIEPQFASASGEARTVTLAQGQVMYVPHGWVVTSSKSLEERGGPSLQLSIVTAAEHFSLGKFIDYVLKTWATMTADGKRVHDDATVEKLGEQGKLRTWINSTMVDVGKPAGASLRYSLPPKSKGKAFLVSEIKTTLEDVLVNAGNDEEACGEESCASVLAGLVAADSNTFGALVAHVQASVVSKTVGAVVSALEEREGKVARAPGFNQTSSWILRWKSDWEGTLVIEEQAGNFIALHVTDPEGGKAVRHFKKELTPALEYVLDQKPREEEQPAWFLKSSMPGGNEFPIVSLALELANLGPIELGIQQPQEQVVSGTHQEL